MDSELGTRGSEFDASQRRKRSGSDTEKICSPNGIGENPRTGRAGAATNEA